jgi:beta-glucosidase
LKTLYFPPGFLWGTATSSHQVEGQNTNNNWWKWEQEAGRIVGGQKSGLACNWWGGRWQEDFDRAAESGQNAHRLSIEWSRVQPAPDKWDKEAIFCYRQIIEGLKKRGLEPMVTLHHFTDPLWISDIGGWENLRTPQYFGIYARKMAQAFQDIVRFWCTINEPNVYAYSGYLTGAFPPGKKDIQSAFKVMANLVRGHSVAYHNIHEVAPQSLVGIALNYRGMKPASPHSPCDCWVARAHSQMFNDFFPYALRSGILNFLFYRQNISQAAQTQDFLGINYYTCDLVAFALWAIRDLFGQHFYPPDSELSENKFIAHRPEGMFESLQWAKRFAVPLIVTENGVEDSQDKLRPRYLVEHITQTWRAIQAGLPVQGYFHWSLLDNFEWERGWTQRFGLWGLDVNSQTRYKRQSVDIYTSICRQNAVPLKVVEI